MLQSSRRSVSLMCDAAMTQWYYILGTQGSLALERAAQHDILSALAFGSVDRFSVTRRNSGHGTQLDDHLLE